MTTAQPTGPGWYEFDGQRDTPSGKWVVMMRDMVKVVAGHEPGTLIVLQAGLAARYSTQLFTGTWRRVDGIGEA